MHSKWIKYLLLLTFAWWATGSARYFHELIEHHGGADNCVDDDDDDDSAATVPVNVAANSPHPGNASTTPTPHHSDQDCVVCKNLAAMAVDQPPQPQVPQPSLEETAALMLHDWLPPVVRCEFIHPTTGPPVSIHI